MNATLEFDFSVDKANRIITVKREFAAELPLVWDAYTKSEILDQWWAPRPWKAKTKIQDFREGGKWQYAMVGPSGEEHWAILYYRKIQAQKSFSADDAFADAAGNVKKDMPQSKWNVTFTNKGQSTLVASHIQYDDLAQLEETIKMGFKEGLSMAMENLDALLPVLQRTRPRN